MPNLPVDVNSWGRLACYPRGSFYPMSHGPSTRCHRITNADFRLCSTCPSRSQAPLCVCTLRLVSIQPEGTFARLRYSLGGDRPSQTAHLPLSACRITAKVRVKNLTRVVFHRRLHRAWRPSFTVSHLSYTSQVLTQWQAAVKLHGVFLSSCG